MNRALVSNIIMSVSITIILVISVINQFYDQLWVGVLIHEGSVLLVIFNGARVSGKGNILSMLYLTMRNLWMDIIQLFKQLKRYYFSDKASNIVLPNQNHATS